MSDLVQICLQAFLLFLGFGFGNLAAAGVFMVFTTVTMVPRYVVRFQIKEKLLLMENLISFGIMVGSAFQMWGKNSATSHLVWKMRMYSPGIWLGAMHCLQGIMGFFYGIFVGTLALSIAEMLDSIPIFARRVRIYQKFSTVIFFVALGKMAGALFYFFYGFPNGR